MSSLHLRETLEEMLNNLIVLPNTIRCTLLYKDYKGWRDVIGSKLYKIIRVSSSKQRICFKFAKTALNSQK